jgi:hypothetical protein
VHPIRKSRESKGVSSEGSRYFDIADSWAIIE